MVAGTLPLIFSVVRPSRFKPEVTGVRRTDPTNPTLVFTITLSDLGADATSVATGGGAVAVVGEVDVPTYPGSVTFYDTDSNRLSVVSTGALPNALTPSPDGRCVQVANEGAPADDFAIDPVASVTIIDLMNGAGSMTEASVRTADLRAFNGHEDKLQAQGVRIFGP